MTKPNEPHQGAAKPREWSSGATFKWTPHGHAPQGEAQAAAYEPVAASQERKLEQPLHQEAVQGQHTRRRIPEYVPSSTFRKKNDIGGGLKALIIAGVVLAGGAAAANILLPAVGHMIDKNNAGGASALNRRDAADKIKENIKLIQTATGHIHYTKVWNENGEKKHADTLLYTGQVNGVVNGKTRDAVEGFCQITHDQRLGSSDICALSGDDLAAALKTVDGSQAARDFVHSLNGTHIPKQELRSLGASEDEEDMRPVVAKKQHRVTSPSAPPPSLGTMRPS